MSPAAVSRLPRRWAAAIGGLQGRLRWRLDRASRRAALAWLRDVMPEESPARHRRIARQAMIAAAAGKAESAAAARLPARVLCRGLRFAGWQHIHTLGEATRALVLAPPFAGWELAVVALRCFLAETMAAVEIRPLELRSAPELEHPDRLLGRAVRWIDGPDRSLDLFSLLLVYQETGGRIALSRPQTGDLPGILATIEHRIVAEPATWPWHLPCLQPGDRGHGSP